jgi:MFS superfamily sulfate permease-like transporter
VRHTPVSIMLSDSLLAGRMGARRWPLAICFVTCCLLAIWQQQWMLGLIQPYVLGGVLVYFGVELLSHWLQRWPALGRAERGILLSTMLTFLAMNVLAGIVVGLVLSAWQFCYRASQQNPLQDIRLQAADASSQQPAVLTAELCGPLYFGSASRLHDQLQAAIAAQLSSGGLVQLCLREASLDSSAMQTLHRLHLWCDEHGYRLQLLCQDGATASQLQRWGMAAIYPQHTARSPKLAAPRQRRAEHVGPSVRHSRASSTSCKPGASKPLRARPAPRQARPSQHPHPGCGLVKNGKPAPATPAGPG